MPFVFYDVETTGLRKRYDQILTFAAILTDEDLVERDRFECNCRLMPQVAPHPAALARNGLTLEDITLPSLRSHYDMACDIARRLEEWGDALYIGYNSIAFDEEFLRQTFYLSLHNPYLTSRPGCGRADVLGLVRTIAFLAPGVVEIPFTGEGRRSFRLEDIAAANGIVHDEAHRAIDDAKAVLDLSRLVRDRDQETWSRFLKMSTKSAVSELLDTEDAFLHIGFRGNDAIPRLVTAVASDRNRRLCLPVTFDAACLDGLDDEAAWTRLGDATEGMVVVEINKCPILAPLYDAPDELVALPNAESLGAALRGNQSLTMRVAALAERNRPDFSMHRELEDRLYEELPLRQDDPVKRRFHASNWSERVSLIPAFQDPRARAAAIRIVHAERPDLLSGDDVDRVRKGIRRRLTEEPGRKAWRTLSAAINGLDEIPHDSRQAMEAAFLAMRDRLISGH